METNKDTFIMRKNWGEQIELLTVNQKAELLQAVFDYQNKGKDFTTTDMGLCMLWITIRQSFEHNENKYKEKCEKNRENINKRWANR